MIRDLLEFFVEYVIPFFIVITISAMIAMVPVDLISQRSCNIFGEETGLEVRYRHFDDCYIKTQEFGILTKDQYERTLYGRYLSE